ncbi:hypothetical protein BJ912DRAFT_1151274 [Pholiota molesta]|nr:hypothetical protein BJ912DRAFT_1151274 [Pholiota molesta]
MFLSFPHPALLSWSSLLFSHSPSPSSALPSSAHPLVDGDLVRLSYNHLRTPSHSMPRTDSGQRRATETYKISPSSVDAHLERVVTLDSVSVLVDYVRYAGAMPLRDCVSEPRCWIKPEAASTPTRMHPIRSMSW